ncbi:hypothetical protein [Duganella sp. Root1480D1]|uniref:hypothetical protein n=1 Tax=Duganella sp. Root1480D1 TaxID=1736471 RepID=UPI0012E3C58A|nr:hypothetical protein [Duganella sp. Root1480D1]
MMKKLMMLSAVAALMLGGSSYAAGVDDATVKIQAPQGSFKLYKGTFDNYANRYALSNDQTIKFTQSGGHYWARLKLEDRVELFPVSVNTFVTAAGTRIEFRDRGEEVVIENFERLPMSVAMKETNVRVVASR